MIPLRHTDERAGFAWVTSAVIAIDLIVFALQSVTGRFGEAIVYVFGFIPARLFHPHAFGYSLFEAIVTLFSSLFLHGSAIHVIGNMLYLYAFGRPVELRMGSPRYALFFLVSGAVGSLSHAVLFPDSNIPSIGASGCIAGVLGACLVLVPKGRIVALIPLVVSWALLEVPGFVFVPIWFVLQFLNGYFAIASAKSVQEIAGVAWWAHIGGFLFGAGVAATMRLGARRAVPAEPNSTAEVTRSAAA